MDVRVSWTVVVWPLLFAAQFSKWLPGGEAVAWGVAWTVALFVTVWTHEMGHIAMGRRCGIETDRMTLRGLGGLAHLSAPAQTPRDEIRIALAGPATHLAWMAGVWPAVWLLQGAHGGTVWFAMLDGFARMQFSMMAFNLLPVWPLDGGRTLRGALATRMDASKASYLTYRVGLAGNVILALAGLLAWLGVADPLGFGSYGFLLILIGIEGFQACRLLRFEALHGDVYGAADPFQRTLLASQAAVREMDAEEERERAARRTAREERARLQATVDRLLDRINEVGGVDRLSAAERRELERASRELAERE